MAEDFLGDDEFIWDDSSSEGGGCGNREDSAHDGFEPMRYEGDVTNLSNEMLMEARLVKAQRGSYLVASRLYARDRRQKELLRVSHFAGGILASARREEEAGNLEILETILSRRHWDSDGVVQDMVDCPERLLNEAGYTTDHLFDPPEEDEPTLRFFCPILCVEVDWDESAALPGCRHRASKQAWASWFQTKLHDAEVLGLHCMLCTRPVPFDFVTVLLSPEKVETWIERLTDVFVQRFPLARNCPGKDCSKVVFLQALPRSFQKERDIKALGYTISMDCQCDCGESFCFACGQEGHLPIPCEVIHTWDRKNQGEADNVVWIFVNTKNCPACKNPIEKNQGCMHMTCRCGFEFCWLCMGDWKKHGGSDYYRCNVYEEEQATNPMSEAELERKRAADSLERYTHFYERYRAHMQGQRLAEDTHASLRSKLASGGPESPPPPTTDDNHKSSPTKKAKREASAERNKPAEGYQVDPSLLVDSRFCERMLDALTQIIDGR
eukprot:Protomagalhaensia_sp_Gyna_25__5784@NODE_847_length_2513_cov_7_926839_g668_i0_p1_GENE_NODE_847_length_2513_cov_7_926839_g668_i0NODE_847_length_2513_cov_7_926839_g668_i0_p1_ORF_typecomplete_len503_score70_44IBR/PF01485_21/1_7e07IBR/PF01485_21/7_6e14zfCCHC/PF00098_23/3_2e03zfCCHC/PF00098_23/2_8e02zfCCHC/PF00098_23/0_067_NODE_847_length_2513_cov_7_926839_g668_i0241511